MLDSGRERTIEWYCVGGGGVEGIITSVSDKLKWRVEGLASVW